ncbi:MAG: transcription termination/antitermination protein NusA [Solobacterium sp.]|nr:transcription termination/antitermination protein NusA [Solobacterium sp.]
MNYKDMIAAFGLVESERSISVDVIKEALKEAIAKAYKKDIEINEIEVEAEINEKKKTIELYQTYTVVEKVEDDEFEISLEDAHRINKDAVIGDKVRHQIEIKPMSRAAAMLAKNVMRQKIREAEKLAVYDEYIDKKYEMIQGTVESVKEKFTLVNLGRTVAMMPQSQCIPGEKLTEGQDIRVVITEVNKDTKGSQVLVSRADSMLIKRLFEKEVPEIYDGIVEIKAIARDAGERTKMAVYSKNPEVDPIGACVGPKGNRVQQITKEIGNEKIDIFKWNDDITELVKNALAPARISAVLPGEDDKSLLVVVDEDQLSLAIGKRGKNARLAVRLTNKKIDIKTREEIDNMGLDFEALSAKMEEERERIRREAAEKEIQRYTEELRRNQEAAALAREQFAEKHGLPEESDEVLPEEMLEHVSDKILTDMAYAANEEEEQKEEQPAAEPEKPEETEAPVVEEQPEAPVKPAPEEPEMPEEEDEEAGDDVRSEPRRRHADLEEMAANNTYVSRFEKLADTRSPKPAPGGAKRKKKKTDEDEYKVRNKDLEEQIKKNRPSFDNRPLYSEEEQAEIEEARLREEEREFDDYDYDEDEYEEYYDDDEN